MIVFILPKIAIELFVLYTGSAYIALAPTGEDLLLNAVAMVFILEIGMSRRKPNPTNPPPR